jgi:acetyl esterase
MDQKNQGSQAAKPSTFETRLRFWVGLAAIVLAAGFGLVFLSTKVVFPAIVKNLMNDVERNLKVMRGADRYQKPRAGGGLAIVRDLSIPGASGAVPMRFYEPVGLKPKAPLIVYFHGGGFVINGIYSSDPFTRALSKKTGLIVLSVAYGLAPEHPYPQGLEDSLAAYLYARENAAAWGADPARIVLAGDSAGGNLSAVLCQLLRDRGLPMPAAQVLLSPPTGNKDDGSLFPSRTLFARSSLLTPSSMDSFLRLYTGKPQDFVNDPYVHPLRAKDLSGLPPALVVTCGKDPLRDEGEEYARRLAAAGVRVETKRYEGRDHDYLGPPVRALIAEFLGTI